MVVRMSGMDAACRRGAGGIACTGMHNLSPMHERCPVYDRPSLELKQCPGLSIRADEPCAPPAPSPLESRLSPCSAPPSY